MSVCQSHLAWRDSFVETCDCQCVALVKLFYLALRNISKKWAMPSCDWRAALNRSTLGPYRPYRRTGAYQGSCLLCHAANGCLSACICAVTTASRSGLSVTALIGDQSRVDQIIAKD
jgi:putative transposase